MNVQRVQDEHMVIVLGQRDHVALGRDLQAAAARDLRWEEWNGSNVFVVAVVFEFNFETLI